MVPQAWRGWRGVIGQFRAGLVGQVTVPAWCQAAARRRRFLVAMTLFIALGATAALTQAWPEFDYPALRLAEIGLFSLLFAWISVGSVTAVMGFWALWRGDPQALDLSSVSEGVIDVAARTAVVMPICNENVATVFGGLRATAESLAAIDAAGLFDVFVLSDSSDPAIRAAEQHAWAALREQLGGRMRVYYRWRKVRRRRKAGNIADFCRRWGRAYRYMVILDADSVMSGDCLASLVRLMERHPRAGIIQTAPRTCGVETPHARLQQFAGRVTGRLFTAGMQFWQLGDSHYWGHNAIIRIEAFMRHAALASMPRKGGHTHILSHDFVEAALLGRAGYETWLAADLSGSYEQQPSNLVEELGRDRRWCEGNLLNMRLVAEPGFRAAHRAMLATGAMAYLSAPLWLLYLVLGTVAAWLSPISATEDLGTGILARVPTAMLCLWTCTAVLLLLPRVLGVLLVIKRGEQDGYGGAVALIASAVLEAGVSILQAPVRMVAHTTYALSAITGLSLDWKSPSREARSVDWAAAVRSFGSLALVIGLIFAMLAVLRPDAAVWVMPVALPLLAAIPLSVLTSKVELGRWVRLRSLLLVPEEVNSPAVLRQASIHARRGALTVVSTGMSEDSLCDNTVELLDREI